MSTTFTYPPDAEEAPQPTNNRQSDFLDTEDEEEEETDTPTHTPHHCNPEDDPPNNQPGGLNGLGGSGAPGGPNSPGGPGGPNNCPNKQDFLWEFMTLLCRVSTTLNIPRPNTIRTKVKEPGTFDGSDPQKLKAFIVSLQLNFNDRLIAFAMDASKVNYTISFLSGTALDWFKPHILCPNLWNLLAWQYSYAAFLNEL
ncbi:hypothetical protein ARMSODRAFT_1015303 [Armillaria solidipes]|uniref:DUF4939 domain-containing protein n=1 Tax=Armillaria solidipes TaxID=1076256 RepID=A0A2H3BSE7_9AGAR|nr:hypothetical protein ARMSODRAFT_1015303 [Armillaria solidipes]